VNEGAATRARDVVAELRDFMRRHRRLFVLSGAGISTGSGIPDYRDAAGAWKRSPPVLFDDFRRREHTRKRYWARSMHGWPRIRQATPNAGHRALAQLEAMDRVERLVTQNVDGLHQRAGNAQVIELHGGLGGVVCLDCGAGQSREAMQRMLAEYNPDFAGAAARMASDGDADLDNVAYDDFRVPDCPQCAGVLKPTVVFFGENVPRDRVAAAIDALDRADAMLVVGTSLMVYSGYRFCERAHASNKPIAAVNLGRTRADAMFAVKLEAACADALPALVASLEVQEPRW
jgi:NAD-dependent SIR2 family protein deacetylase